jgi:hypothetical protein
MTDCDKLVKDLHDIETTMFALGTSPINMDNVSIRLAYDKRWGQTANDAADAIEALQAEVDTLKRADIKRCQECLYLGQPVGEQLLPKRGEWIKDEEQSQKHVEAIYRCSACHNFDAWGATELYPYCPNCGAKMEVQE